MTDRAHPALPASVELGSDVIWQKVDGQVVLLALNPGRYYALDTVGSRIWEVLLEDSDVAHAQERLLMMFDVDDPTLRRDLAELIARLVGADLLEVTA
ncbi:MAG: PqqD family protein [Actinomycetota bacterium]|nr:PqqD family protein [Actinomycetota bacterium]